MFCGHKISLTPRPPSYMYTCKGTTIMTTLKGITFLTLTWSGTGAQLIYQILRSCSCRWGGRDNCKSILLCQLLFAADHQINSQHAAVHRSVDCREHCSVPGTGWGELQQLCWIFYSSLLLPVAWLRCSHFISLPVTISRDSLFQNHPRHYRLLFTSMNTIKIVMRLFSISSAASTLLVYLYHEPNQPKIFLLWLVLVR